MQTYTVKIVFDEPLLGTAPMDEELYTNFIRAKAEDVDGTLDELETLTPTEEIEKGTTGFHRLDGEPILYDYVIKGFFKDACGMLRRDKESASSKVMAYKKIIDGMVFVAPRRIPIEVAGEIYILERPLRAQTAQGERVALARSEAIPEGSGLSFKVMTMGDAKKALLDEWFTYGALRGLGQWRNAGYGRFTYTITETV